MSLSGWSSQTGVGQSARRTCVQSITVLNLDRQTYTDTDRERHRERERERDRERQTDRQRQSDRGRYRQTDKQRSRVSGINITVWFNKTLKCTLKYITGQKIYQNFFLIV